MSLSVIDNPIIRGWFAQLLPAGLSRPPSHRAYEVRVLFQLGAAAGRSCDSNRYLSTTGRNYTSDNRIFLNLWQKLKRNPAGIHTTEFAQAYQLVDWRLKSLLVRRIGPRKIGAPVRQPPRR